MQSYRDNVLARPDTLLGVCQAIGDDLGFNPIYLRIALSMPLIWNPFAMIGAYLALGAIVAVSRLLFPAPRLPAALPEPAVEAASPQPAPEPVRATERELELAA